MIDAGVSAGNVPDAGYFHDIFPYITYGNYVGAQAYYAQLQNNRGNEFTQRSFASCAGMTRIRFDGRSGSSSLSARCRGLPWWMCPP